jgi:hypothetical protein
MSTSTEKTSQKLFETITALGAALEATEAQFDSERASESDSLKQRIAEVVKTVPSAWPGAAAAVGGAARPWPAEPEAQRALQRKLVALRDNLLDLLTNDGPTRPSHHIMRKAYASSAEIVLLLVLGFVGTVTTLTYVIDRWPHATPREDSSESGAKGSGRPSDDPTPPSPSTAASASSGVPADGAAPPTNEGAPPPTNDAAARNDVNAGERAAVAVEASVPDGGRPDAGARDAAPAAAGAADGRGTAMAVKAEPLGTELQKAVSVLDAATKKLEQKARRVPEDNVLTMIVLLGALGGFVHLTSSLAKYVGTRKLLRSWIIYYLLMPVSGAGLAPMTYLLLRVGVVGNGSGEMNLFGLYAFAALTGLFAEQALEKLADVFSRVFAKPSETDALDATETRKKGT